MEDDVAAEAAEHGVTPEAVMAVRKNRQEMARIREKYGEDASALMYCGVTLNTIIAFNHAYEPGPDKAQVISDMYGLIMGTLVERLKVPTVAQLEVREVIEACSARIIAATLNPDAAAAEAADDPSQ